MNTPNNKRREVNKYVRKYSDIENCISYDVMKYMMENAHLYPTLEMADNALSRYIAQKGKCAVTHNALSISDMVCVHIKPCKGERNDAYRNLIILSKRGVRTDWSNESCKNWKVAYRLTVDRRNER